MGVLCFPNKAESGYIYIYIIFNIYIYLFNIYIYLIYIYMIFLYGTV